MKTRRLLYRSARVPPTRTAAALNLTPKALGWDRIHFAVRHFAAGAVWRGRSRNEERCLLVRYGADIYLERMASDSDKREGRLRNRVLPNRVSIIPAPSWRIWERLIHWWKCRVLFYTPVQPDSNNIEGNFLLPVHQRLGTQFKLFFQIKACAPVEAWARTAAAAGADASAAPAGPGRGQGPRLVNWRPRDPQAVAARQVAEALALRYGLSPDEITEVPEYRSWLRFRPPAYRCHLWFCLDSFPKVKTVEHLLSACSGSLSRR